MSIRPQLTAGTALALLVALGGCARSDAITGGGGDGSGGFDPVDTSGAPAGPEVGSGAGTGIGGADGDPLATTGAGQGGSTGAGDLCGDGTCQIDVESCDTCPDDCGGPCGGSCGDGACDAPTETCDTCAADCGACAAVCGDGVCEAPTEDCESCSDDCGLCPCLPDDLEPNGGSGSASPLALNVEVSDLSICAGDFDWHSFSVSGTRTITLRFLDANGDLDVEVYAQATGNYVTGAYSGTDDEQIVLSGQPAGTYWARVYGADGATNANYAIIVSN